MNPLLLRVSRLGLFQSDLATNLVRAAMVFTFYLFGVQKWNAYTATMLVPLISHSPVVFWLEPVFGVRGAGFFLGTTELITGTLFLLSFWNRTVGIFAALGSLVTFFGTTTIVFFLPDAWAKEAGGFPIMTLPLAFLMKDFLFLAVSFFLLKHDLLAAISETPRPALRPVPSRAV